MKNALRIATLFFWFLPTAFSQVCTFQTINVPGAVTSAASGINDQGAVVGNWTKTTGITHQSFLLFQGNFSFFTFPGSSATTAGNINNHSVIVGSFVRSGFNHGFMVHNGNFQQIDVPFANQGTFARGINNNGDIVGFFNSPSGPSPRGFLLHAGNFAQFTFPGSVSTEANGINVNSIIVGTYKVGDVMGVDHGFMVRNGSFQNIDFPTAVNTRPSGINDSNEIVGTYTLGDDSVHGFVLVLATNTFITIDNPSAEATSVAGVNNNNFVVGSNGFDPNTIAFQANCQSVF
jgi:uncharacterized membrane protein